MNLRDLLKSLKIERVPQAEFARSRFSRFTGLFMNPISLKPYRDRKAAIENLERSLERTRDPAVRMTKAERIQFMRSVGPALPLVTAEEIGRETASKIHASGPPRTLKRL